MKLEKGQIAKKEISVEVVDLGERQVQFTISKEVEDRDGDILRAGGVDFTNYEKNPVFLGFHNSLQGRSAARLALIPRPKHSYKHLHRRRKFKIAFN